MSYFRNKLPIGTTIPLLLLLLSHLAHSRETPELISDGLDSATSLSLLDWRVAAPITCEPIYGFLPCATSAWGLVFLIVVYEILLSVGGQLVANGSNLFFQMIGPGVLGASLFQILGTIPQIVLVLVSALSSSTEAAQQRATLSMGLVAGTTVMLLTLILGSSVVVGSYDLSAPIDNSDADSQKQTTLKGYGVVTDAETSYTARIILATLVPFLVLLLTNLFSSARRAIILTALVMTVVLLLAYSLYQIFQPWIQNRQFEYLMNKYAKDKLLKLVSRNGKPDTQKIQQLFNKINKNNNANVSATELRLLLLGVRMDEDDKSTERDVENIMAAFDTSGDGNISRDEFIQGMTKLVSNLSNQTSLSAQAKSSGSTGSQGLLASSSSQPASNSWLNYLRAAFYVIAGTVMLCVLSEPLIRTVVDFAAATKLSSFAISYLAIPFAMNYGIAVQSITSARQKTQKSISLTLSSIYGGVYMNNVIGLIVFLAPVYALNLTADASLEILVVMIFCIGMNIFVSFCTTFLRWVGYLVILLYPISLAAVYIITSLVTGSNGPN